MLWLSAARAGAQSPDDERARVHFVAGNAYFKAGQWDEAAHEFQQAYDLSGRPEMLINLARTHERAGRLRQAVADLQLLLERYPKTAYKAEQRIARMRSSLDASAVAEQGSPASLAHEPGAAPQSEAADLSMRAPRLRTLLLGATALAAGAAALTTGLIAHGRYGDLESDCPDGSCTARYADEREQGRRLARTSTGLSFGAFALASATAVLWYLDVRSARASERAKIDLSLGPTHANAQLRLTF